MRSLFNLSVGSRFDTRHRGARVATLVVTAGTLLGPVLFALPGCGSRPDEVTIENTNPWTGNTRLEKRWKKEGDPGNLPPGWTPGEEQTVDIVVDGRTYRIRLCIARAVYTDCIYIKNGGCSEPGDWQLYCPISEAGESDLHQPISADADAVPLCPSYRGSADYNPLTGNSTFSYTLLCDVPLPRGLVDVSITTPQGITLPSERFGQRFGGIIPAGSKIAMDGPPPVIAWNCHQLGITGVSFENEFGQRVDAGIGQMRNGPALGFVALDGEIVLSGPIADPR